jgi:hypothetical protein
MGDRGRQAARADVRYVLAVGEDAKAVVQRDDVIVLRQLPDVVLVEVDQAHPLQIAPTGPFLHVYSSQIEALRAFALFDPNP